VFWPSFANLMILKLRSGKPSLQVWDRACLKIDRSMRVSMESSLTGKPISTKLLEDNLISRLVRQSYSR